MAYKQNAGRDNLTNLNIAALTNGGDNPTDPPKKKVNEMVTVQTSDGYDIDVAKDSNMHKQFKEMGSVIQSMRSINVNEKTDPRTSNISQEDMKARIKALEDLVTTIQNKQNDSGNPLIQIKRQAWKFY